MSCMGQYSRWQAFLAMSSLYNTHPQVQGVRHPGYTGRREARCTCAEWRILRNNERLPIPMQKLQHSISTDECFFVRSWDVHQHRQFLAVREATFSNLKRWQFILTVILLPKDSRTCSQHEILNTFIICAMIVQFEKTTFLSFILW